MTPAKQIEAEIRTFRCAWHNPAPRWFIRNMETKAEMWIEAPADQSEASDGLCFWCAEKLKMEIKRNSILTT